jgi:hypothetical protein
MIQHSQTGGRKKTKGKSKFADISKIVKKSPRKPGKPGGGGKRNK